MESLANITVNDNVLAAVWREASRHTDLNQAVRSIESLLHSEFAICRIQIFAVDAACSVISQIADSFVPPASFVSIALSEARCTALSRWITQSPCVSVADIDRVNHALSEAQLNLMPTGVVGGLCGEQGARGLLVMDFEATSEGKSGRCELASQLLEPLATALDHYHHVHELYRLRVAAEADNERLRNRLGRDPAADTIVGAKVGLRDVLERIAKVSGADLPILILGETGSGKEVIAREIHTRSPRAAQPFIRVNCGAIPPELIDSELFGHEKGSFTGATSQRLGWFERANDGTLFLDEIGDLPSAAQVRLLRVLQDGLIQRVGGHGDVQVNVRVVAATHRDLPALIRDGHFREDLWYRLATFPILLPPLRERIMDIPALTAHFAQRAAKRFGLKLQLPTDTDLALLAQYPWPGNVRELQAVIDRAAILGDGHCLEIGKALGNSELSITTTPVDKPHNKPAPRFRALDDIARDYIGEVLNHTQGRIEGPHGAAKILAVNPHTLRARMRKLNIQWNTYR